MLAAQSPSFFRFMVGKVRITQLYDGALAHSDPHRFFAANVEADAFARVAQAEALDGGSFDFPVTVTLIETEGQRILVDAGHGPTLRPEAGQLLDAMARACIDRQTIDQVVITHMHRDHVGGLLDEAGAPAFANAKHLVCPLDHAYWTGPACASEVGVLAVKVSVALGKQLVFAEPGDPIAPNVRLIDSSGHTPGHMCVMVESEAQAMLVASDLANHPVLSLRQPDWHMSLDWDGPKAAQVRRRLLGESADKALLFAGYHMPFPALGHVVRQKDGDGFVYCPLGER